VSESLVAERSDPGLPDGGVRPSGHAAPHAAPGTAHADGGSCAEPHPGAGRPDPDGSAPHADPRRPRGPGRPQDRHRDLPLRPGGLALRGARPQRRGGPDREPQRRQGAQALRPEGDRRRAHPGDLHRRSRRRGEAGGGVPPSGAGGEGGPGHRLHLQRRLPGGGPGGRGAQDPHRAL